jgi:hypothetical protein
LTKDELKDELTNQHSFGEEQKSVPVAASPQPGTLPTQSGALLRPEKRPAWRFFET